MIDTMLAIAAGLLVPGGGVALGIALGNLLDLLHPLRPVTPRVDNDPTQEGDEDANVRVGQQGEA